MDIIVIMINKAAFGYIKINLVNYRKSVCFLARKCKIKKDFFEVIKGLLRGPIFEVVNRDVH